MATRKPIIYINGYPNELDTASDRLNSPWIYRSGTAPTAQTADIWYDTSTSVLKMWNGSAWEAVNAGNQVYIQTSAPTSGMSSGDWWYDTNNSSLKIYLAGSINAWTAVGGSGGGASGGGTDTSFLENQVTVTSSYEIGSGNGDKNAVSVGPMTIQNGAVITVPANRLWVIL
tara:strand:- start:8674 stop:9189 length:516 start_codon:yes stop_codon:yes gene_type:complete